MSGPEPLRASPMVGETGKVPLSLRRELKQTIAELELCSHVSAVSLEPSGRDSGEDIGGKRPPGGVDRAEDRQIDDGGDERPAVLKSAEHFKRRATKAKSEPALQAILEDAQRTLVAYRRAAPPVDPTLDDPQWKRFVSESSKPSNKLAEQYGVSTRYINKVRAQYRDRQAA